VFPIRDDNPTLKPPYATYLIIALNVLAWVLVQGMGTDPALGRSVCEFGAIPGALLGTVSPGTQVPLGPKAICIVQGASDWFTVLTSMFMHGSWLHIIGNMWFLAIFGDNVEDSMSHGRYLLFYLLCGVAAVAAQIVSSPHSAIPMVGASGAIGGIMGAYAVLYPRARVHMLVFLGFYVTSVVVPAAVMLGYWFLLQLIAGLPSMGGEEGGVAFFAHAGGFLTGVLLCFVFRDPERVAAHKRAIARSWDDRFV
jgi:membrane associated rhomboid family serine protease